jgi:hypothetical protein
LLPGAFSNTGGVNAGAISITERADVLTALSNEHLHLAASISI